MTGKIFFYLLIAGLILRIVFLLLIPPYSGNDEPAHLLYAQHILNEKKLPNTNLYTNENLAGNEYFQPPLYYSVVAIFLSFSKNPLTQLYMARLISIVFFVSTFFFAKKILIQLKTNAVISISTIAVISLLPGYIFNSVTVSNDSLTIFIASATIYYLIIILHKPLTPVRLTILATLSALALLSKLNGTILIPAIIFFIYKKHAKAKGQLFQNIFFFLGVAFMPIASWSIYNLLTYNNLLGPIQASTATFTKVPFGLFKIFLVARGTFATFWVAWGPANEIRLPIFVYILVFLISLFSAAGLAKLSLKFFKNWNTLSPYTLLAIALFANITLLFIFNITQFQPLGRYLYPSIIPISLFFVLGINSILSKRYQKLIPTLIISSLIFMNFLGLVTILHY